MTELQGLQAFKYDGAAAIWAAWTDWPHLSLALDQGADGVSASWWMMAQDRNITIYWDASHGAVNDWKALTKDTRLYTFLADDVGHMERPFGPMSDRLRWHELSQAWESMFANLSSAECPLFAEKAEEILRQRGGLGSLGGEGDDIHGRLWEDLRRDPPFVAGQQKVNIARFFNSTERAKAELSGWDTVLLNLECLALETGLLTSRKLHRLNFKEPRQENDDTSREAERTGRPQMDERLLRTSCKNAVEVGVYMLCEPEHTHWVNIVLAAGGPTEAWHRDQNYKLRSVEGSRLWMIEQLSGSFAAHLHKTWGQLKNLNILKSCGMRIQAFDDQADAGLIVAQDDLADLLGMGVVSMVFHREQRNMWSMRGWPVRMSGVLAPPLLRAKTLKAFRDDYKAFEELKAHPFQSPEIQDLLKRSVFNQRSVMQYVLAAQETQFEFSARLQTLAHGRASTVIRSQCSEDLFSSAKNSKLCKERRTTDDPRSRTR